MPAKGMVIFFSEEVMKMQKLVQKTIFENCQEIQPPQ